MPRRGRRLWWLTAGLLALVVMAWVDSHFYTHGIWCSRPTWAVSVKSKQGGFMLYRTGRVSRSGWIRMRRPTDNVAWPLSYHELFDGHAFGFAYAAGKPMSTGPAYGIAVPYWLLAGALALATWHLLRRAARAAPGCCPVCGYDLRGSPERCPECGTPAPRERGA